ncbi:lymphocyte function-associated antigen 3 isoform X2 [Megalobrama amblycephala]|uniref:lymphocyte function-associated antigen 3 isoform X2 n=1 Tax=Megalobrama amblycephala TaxID=75352 RepID=UPI0020140859|nr:lymphocyte function-associated antigen 3 isoform X2 [Megalobrama amblycephala]
MAVTKTLVYIACLCFARDFVFCDDYEEVGNEIILTPRIRGKPEDILWKHNDNKVLEYDGSKVDEYGSFRGRVVVDFETGELTIRKLNSQDSGQYQADIVINGKVQSSSHTLTVLDALVEPQVNCELDEISDVKKLLCSVESQTLISYEWSGPNINVHSGHELVVDKQEENLDSVYTCTVKNRVNRKSTDFTLKDCHTGREGSAVLVPVLIVTALLLIVLIALAVFLYIVYRRKKQKLRSSESRNTDTEYGQNLLSNVTTESMPGSSDAIATIPSHIRLPFQKESIADKKWDQDSGETVKLLSDTNSLQEQSQVSENVKTSPELQNEGLEEQETEDNNEDNQTPGETEEALNRLNTGSSDVTLPNRTRLSSQKEPVADKKCDRDKELEKNLKQSPQSVSETNQENTGKGNEGEVDKNEKNSENADETEKPLQSQEEEEKEKSQILKQESENGKTSPEHQNEGLEEQETEDNNEDNQTPGETEEVVNRLNTGSSGVTLPSHSRLSSQKEPVADKKCDQDKEPEDLGETDEGQTTKELPEQIVKQSPQSVSETNQENTGKGNEGEVDKKEKNSENADETEKPLQSQEEEEKEKSQILKQESENGKTSPEHQNEGIEEKKPEDNNEDNQTPGQTEEAIDGPDKENVSPQSDVTERNVVNEAEQVHENKKKSQNDESLRNQKTEDAANSGNDMRPGDTRERSEEKNNEGIDGPNTVDQPVDGEAPGAPAVTDSPATMEKDPINSSVAASSQSDLYNHTSQDKEKERKRSGLDQDEKGKVVTNQEEKGAQEQMSEEKTYDPETSEEKKLH